MTAAKWLILAALFVSGGIVFGWGYSFTGLILLCGGIQYLSNRRDALRADRAGKVELEIKNDHLAMGATLGGQVIVTAKEPIQGYKIFIRLTLQALVEVVNQQSDGSTDSVLITKWVELESSSSVLSVGAVHLAEGEARADCFEVVAPMHAKTEEAKTDSWNRWTMPDADKIKGMSADELLERFRLRWLVSANVDLTGLPALLHAERELRVTGCREA